MSLVKLVGLVVSHGTQHSLRGYSVPVVLGGNHLEELGWALIRSATHGWPQLIFADLACAWRMSTKINEDSWNSTHFSGTQPIFAWLRTSSVLLDRGQASSEELGRAQLSSVLLCSVWQSRCSSTVLWELCGTRPRLEAFRCRHLYTFYNDHSFVAAEIMQKGRNNHNLAFS